MSRVQKHPTDEGKFQSTFDDYGHGKGNGKSRNAIYKHFKKINSTNEPQVKEIKVDEPNPEITQNQEIDESEEIEIEVDDTKWGKIGWTDDEEEGVEPIPKTIPKPISEMNKKKISKITMAAQGQAIRYGFKALDRLVTHWGRGVMNNKEWEIKRHESDYDTLEESTSVLMEHYGIMLPVNPLMVWGMTITSAYAPPITHVMKNRDPNRKRKGILSKIFRRKRKKAQEVDYSESDIKP